MGQDNGFGLAGKPFSRQVEDSFFLISPVKYDRIKPKRGAVQAPFLFLDLGEQGREPPAAAVERIARVRLLSLPSG